MSSDEENDKVMELPKPFPKKIQINRRPSPLVKNAIKATQMVDEQVHIPVPTETPKTDNQSKQRYFPKCPGCYNCNWTGYGDSEYCRRDYYN